MLAAYLVAAPLLTLSFDNPDDFYEPPLLEIGGPPPCDSSKECLSDDFPHCHPGLQECTECVDAEHCPEGWSCDENGHCEDVCETAEDCDPTTEADICHPDSGVCVECVGAGDCTEDEYCQGDQCLADHCTPGQRLCFGLTLVECGRDGGTTTTVEKCTVLCQKTDDGAECLGEDESTGAGGEGDSTAGGGATSADGTASGGATGGNSGTGSATGTDAPSGTSAPADAGGEGTMTLPAEDSCACRADDSAPRGLWLLALGVLGLRRRR